MQEPAASWTFSPPDSDVVVQFGPPERPHSDELTLFAVTIHAHGLDAAATVESLSGDFGVRPDVQTQRGEVTEFDGAHLSGFLRELGQVSKPWEGARHWRSLADELRIEATCDSLGHVTLVVTLTPRPWAPSWSASATFTYALGDLLRLADGMESWFTP